MFAEVVGIFEGFEVGGVAEFGSRRFVRALVA